MRKEQSDQGVQFLSSLKPQKKGVVTPRLAERGMHPAALNHHLGASPHTLHTGDLHNPPINPDMQLSEFGTGRQEGNDSKSHEWVTATLFLKVFSYILCAVFY